MLRSRFLRRYSRAEENARAAIEKYRGTLEIAFVQNDYLTGEPKPCMGGWGRSYMCINPAGEVMPCHAASVIPGLRFETVRDSALGDIWRDSPAMNAFRGDDWMMEPCRTCPRKEIDFGGCRCQALLLTGDAAATDPVCSLAPAHLIVESALAGTNSSDAVSQPVHASSFVQLQQLSSELWSYRMNPD